MIAEFIMKHVLNEWYRGLLVVFAFVAALFAIESLIVCAHWAVVRYGGSALAITFGLVAILTIALIRAARNAGIENFND